MSTTDPTQEDSIHIKATVRELTTGRALQGSPSASLLSAAKESEEGYTLAYVDKLGVWHPADTEPTYMGHDVWRVFID